MGKKKIWVWLCFWLLVLGGGLTGCKTEDASQLTLEDLEKKWEQETSLSSQEDIPKDIPEKTDTKEETQTEIGQVSSSSQELPFSFEYEKASQFAYNSLNEIEKIWYQDINRILSQMQEKDALSEVGIENGLEEASIDKIFQCVVNDHPEYFYVDGYTYTSYKRKDKLVKIEFAGNYNIDLEEAKKRKKEIEEAAEIILQQISMEETDYNKVKYVYETLILNTDYDLAAPDNQNIYSVFVNHISVCQGYAKATQYLLNRMGVECTIAMGTVNTGEGHAWNLVLVEGNYYYVDTTWGDPSYQSQETEENENYQLPQITYDYLCVTTSQILRTHVLGGAVPMPQCDSLEANYYVQEGTYFTNCDTQQLSSVFNRCREQNKTEVTLKCADWNTYQELEQLLIGEQKIFEYLDSPEGVISYAQNEKQLSMLFWMAKE